MKPLPQEYILLKKIKEKLDKLMSDKNSGLEIRSTDLYDYIKKYSELKDAFPTGRKFNQFLRAQHDSGLMGQVISNYRVDTLNKEFYQWYFRK